MSRDDPLTPRQGMSDEEVDHSPMPVGRYKGQTPSQIAEHDPWYLVTLAKNVNWKVASDTLLNDCENG